MTKAASSDSSSFIGLHPACLDVRADTGCGLTVPGKPDHDHRALNNPGSCRTYLDAS
jgi:hypothetical protein